MALCAKNDAAAYNGIPPHDEMTFFFPIGPGGVKKHLFRHVSPPAYENL